MLPFSHDGGTTTIMVVHDWNLDHAHENRVIILFVWMSLHGIVILCSSSSHSTTSSYWFIWYSLWLILTIAWSINVFPCHPSTYARFCVLCTTCEYLNDTKLMTNLERLAHDVDFSMPHLMGPSWFECLHGVMTVSLCDIIILWTNFPYIFNLAYIL